MNMGANIRRLTHLFLLLFVALSGGLVYWQVIAADAVTSNPHNVRLCLPHEAPLRGRIFDRNGVLLADSRPSKTGCGGYVRHYYEPSLAALVGSYISPLYGSTGIEAQYGDYLSGRAGWAIWENQLNRALHRPPVGDDIYLTIDVRVQRLVDHYFDADANAYPPDGEHRFASDRGSVIVSDPRTGQIIAMLSRPGYDPNRVVTLDPLQQGSPNSRTYYDQLNADPEQPLLERPLAGRYVPGSTYKMMTLLAALDSGRARLSDPFDAQHALGPVFINGEKFGPTGSNIAGYTHTFPVDVRYGFAHSDNVIFAQLGVRVTAATWLDYNRRFFVGSRIPFDLPAAESLVTPAGGDLSANGLAEDAFGQGVDFVSPLQMTLIDNAVANDGRLMRPSLVLKIVDPNGAIVQSFASQLLGEPISQETAAMVREAMYGVTLCGSGSVVPQLANSPWAILSKTGTGEPGGGAPPQAWLVAQAPYQSPALAIVAMRENGGEGSYTNGPLVADIYQAIYADQAIKEWKPAPPPAPDPQYCTQTGLRQP